MKKISVVMATYNGEMYIESQLESIANQTLQPDEIIISDDCSSDSTVHIINQIKTKLKIPIKLFINEKNVGYINNFRKALSKVTGNYIFLCDQDDIWECDKVKETIIEMKINNAEVACTGFRLIDGNGNFIKNLSVYNSDPICGYKNWTNKTYQIPLKRLIWGNFSPGCTYCFSNNVLAEFMKIKNIEVSHDFQILLIGANQQAAIYIDKPLSRYRLHSNNTIGMNKKEKKKKRHFEPRLSRFLKELSKYCSINNYCMSNIILYLRLPKLRSIIIHFLHLENKLNL